MLHHENREMYKVEGLTKSYGEGSAYSEVIKDINFTINSGEYFLIIGPSGSGKSTLLYLLAGLETPSQGSVHVRGQDIKLFDRNTMATFHRIHIGIVYQSFHLLPSFTILENVAFPLVLQGLRMKKREERAMEVLSRFGIDALANHLPSQVSGGQQQKAAIARAMINMPPILLIDEPTGNLDTKSSQEVMDIIEMLHKQGGRTIIMVSHNTEFIKYSTRTIHIIDGKVYDKPSDIPSSTSSDLETIQLMENIKANQDEDIDEFMINPFDRM